MSSSTDKGFSNDTEILPQKHSCCLINATPGEISAMCNIRYSFYQENMHLTSPDFRQVFMFSLPIAPVEGCTLFTQYFLCAGSMMVFFPLKITPWCLLPPLRSEPCPSTNLTCLINKRIIWLRNWMWGLTNAMNCSEYAI